MFSSHQEFYTFQVCNMLLSSTSVQNNGQAITNVSAVISVSDERGPDGVKGRDKRCYRVMLATDSLSPMPVLSSQCPTREVPTVSRGVTKGATE